MDNSIDTMSTVSEVLEKLRKNKVELEFRWTPKGFTAGQDKFYQPGDLEIVKTFRFEGASNPSDMAILFVLQVKDGGLIGYSLDAYGSYSSHDREEGYDNFIRQIPEQGHSQQLLFEL